jgi:DNA-binding response OmpR family regulator
MNRLEGVKVVLVDDDPDVLEAMDTAMKAEGAVTRTVADGNEAVSACQEVGPDLVVLDMMLPKRSGFLVLEKIKGYENCPSVIMLTANEGKRHQAYAESLGVDRYLLKPVPLEKLLAVSVELVAKRAAGETEAAAGKAAGADAAPAPTTTTRTRRAKKA